MQEILWLVNSAANDLQQVTQNPKLACDMIIQKLQSINNVAAKLNHEFTSEIQIVTNVDKF